MKLREDGRMFSHAAALKAGRMCGSCRTRITRGEGLTPKDKGFFCHVDRTDRIGEVKLIHEQRVGRKQVDCLWCHDKIEHGKIRMSRTAI